MNIFRIIKLNHLKSKREFDYMHQYIISSVDNRRCEYRLYEYKRELDDRRNKREFIEKRKAKKKIALKKYSNKKHGVML